MLIGRKRICLGTYAVVDFGCKVTYSSPLTRKSASNRLYFNNFKDRIVHFYGTVVKLHIFVILLPPPQFPLERHDASSSNKITWELLSILMLLGIGNTLFEDNRATTHVCN